MGEDHQSDDIFYSTVQAFYRGEMQRSNVWRQRLDTTTNWAVILTAGVLTWAFSSPSHPHIVMLLSALLLTVFSVIEARRYRFFDVWRSRVRVIEENIIAPTIDPDHTAKNADWSDVMSEDLNDPHFKINFLEAWSRRVKRTYIWIISTILLAWVIKVIIHPGYSPGIDSFIASAGSTGIPGTVIVPAVGILYILLIGLSLYSELHHRTAKGAMSGDGDDTDWQDI